MKRISLTRPYITEAIKQRVCAVLDSGHITEGSVTQALEQAFADYTGARHAIAVTSCSIGLELALRAAGIGPGDEVIIPDYTYPATALAVLRTGAMPVIVDVDMQTLTIAPEEAARAITQRTKAIMPVSLFGNPLDYTWINNLKEKHGLVVIEDAACSIGATWRGSPVGTFADMTVFSLHPRKFITTGEGGIITTNNADWAAWLVSYKHFGLEATQAGREGASFVRNGTNFKLSDVLAAIGLGQMQDIDLLLRRRREQAARYLRLLSNVPGVKLPAVTPQGEHSWQTFYVFVRQRGAVLQRLRGEGIEAQIGTYSLHMHKAFQTRDCRLAADLRDSAAAYACTLALPLHHYLTTEEQELVVDALRCAITAK